MEIPGAVLDDGTRIMIKDIPVEVRNALGIHKRYHRWKVQQYHDQLETQFGTLFLKRLEYLCEHVETVQFRGNYPGWWGETMRTELSRLGRGLSQNLRPHPWLP